MILSCPQGNSSERPSSCHKCNGSVFHAHGYYFRVVADILVPRFRCATCKDVTVSMLPSHCVPYKHHLSNLIQTIISRLITGKRIRAVANKAGIALSTCYRWLSAFGQGASLLATEGAERLGIAPISGSYEDVFQELSNHFHKSSIFFKPLQVALCQVFPPLGIFRSLIPIIP